MPTNNQLPPKENNLFKRILKCYEQKQYTKGLKFAKQILSVPQLSEHGETLAMKGLTLNCLGRKDEAYDHVRRGLRNDLTSHVCWHVYGLLQRSDRKYDEAIKCYRNALKWDKDNLQILRDLSLLQVQMRDLEGYRDTRYQLLVLRPTQRASWIGYAMAYHLLKQYDMALKILDEFRKTQTPKSFDYEHSELLLYINMVLRESGKLTEAIDHLDKYEKDIVDKLSLNEIKGELFVSLDKHEDAVSIYRSLVERNPENSEHYTKLISASKLESESEKLALFEELREKFPRSGAPRRLPLSVATGESFTKLADLYLRQAIHKGMPATFVTLKPLYNDPEKVKLLEELILGYEKNLREVSLFDPNDTCEEKEPPTALLWTYYYISQHYSHVGAHSMALEYINKAIEHTPLLIELHAMKAKLYKRAGDMEEATIHMEEAQSLDTADRYINSKSGDMEEATVHMEEAQSLDTADRYINSKCAKYLLRVCQVQQASDMCAKFARDGVSAIDNLKEMQCMWFETECALAYQKLGRWGDALKKCIEVDRHFTEIIEDQFDFHTYCMRKMTLRAYIGLLRLEDVLRCHPFYYRAAMIAIDIYLHLHDHPHSSGDSDSVANAENLSPAEIKKLKNKERKARKKAAIERTKQAEQDKKDAQQAKAKPDGDLDGPKEEALVPEDLAKVEDPLSHAIRFLKPLQTLASDKIETHVKAYEIYSRKGRLLLMLQCIKRGCRVDHNNPQFHICKARFLQFVKEKTAAGLDDTTKAVLDQEMPPLYEGKTVSSLNEGFLQSNPLSLPHRLAAGVVMVEIEGACPDAALSLVTQLTPDITAVSIQAASEVLQHIKSGTFGKKDDAATTYQETCHERFPYAVAFFKHKPSPRSTNDTPKPDDTDDTQQGDGITSADINDVSKDAVTKDTVSKDDVSKDDVTTETQKELPVNNCKKVIVENGLDSID